MSTSDFWEKMKKELESYQQPDDIDCYRSARNSYLQRCFPDYPTLIFKKFTVSFVIGSTAKNAPLVYAILDTLPSSVCSVEINKVSISIEDESSFIKHVHALYDLLAVAGSWKSFTISFRDVIMNRTEFGYLVSYIDDRNKSEMHYYRRSADELRRKYLAGDKRRTKKNIVNEKVCITKEEPEKSLRTVINQYITMYCKHMDVQEYRISSHDVVLKIEDSLIVDFRLVPKNWRSMHDDQYGRDWDFPCVMIQELTHNDLFKFNYQGFRRSFVFDSIGIDFFKFHGLNYYVRDIDNFPVVDKALPELELQRRFDEYGGETYHFLIFKMVDIDGSKQYGAGYTKGVIHSFVLKLCKELEETNSRSLELNGASCLSFPENRGFIKAFLSWKGKKKRWRLENKFSYYYVDRQIKDDADLFLIPGQLISNAYAGEYDPYEFGEYSKPLNRWKSEELVFNITKKLYHDYQVIYQYRPFFLQTENGNMSYDVYICGLKVAIEYQGKQHFEPVDYFGGKENFEKQQERDKLKAERSRDNGIKLIYVNYWESITPALIKSRVEEAMK